MDKNAPQLPTELSSDGREIWEWASKFSVHVHRQDEIRKTRVAIASIGKRCGDCDKWMKSRQCPMERNVNGRNHGPSCEARVCGQFVECSFATRRRSELTDKLNALSGVAS